MCRVAWPPTTAVSGVSPCERQRDARTPHTVRDFATGLASGAGLRRFRIARESVFRSPNALSYCRTEAVYERRRSKVFQRSEIFTLRLLKLIT